ncbi:MAG: hypothetical protein FJZ04_00460 [Candidatus Moranbacteria bacterium]|nr:hypothetical protein [Candidatus Moranbacteria bacterium]
MNKETKKAELEEKLIEELEENYDDNKGNRKLLIIGGAVAIVLVVIAVILSLVSGSKKEQTKEQAAAELSEQGLDQTPGIVFDENYSRGAGTDTAQKAGEPKNAYPAKTSGARVAVDEAGNPIEGVPIQKSLMIDENENPLSSLNTITPDISGLMEINLYNTRNAQLPLSEFLDRSRIEVPENLFSRLDSFYRIFMYRAPEEKGPGTALVLSTGMEKSELDKALGNWESSLINTLKPFILIGLKKDFVEASGQKTFQNSNIYRGARFVDFSGNGVVSLNYIVVGKYIIFANSQTSFEKAIKLLQK